MIHCHAKITDKEVLEQHNFKHLKDFKEWVKTKNVKDVCPYSNGDCFYTCLLKS